MSPYIVVKRHCLLLAHSHTHIMCVDVFDYILVHMR